MPPLPKLRIAALEELEKQLRFAPPETLRRQLERTEQLAAELDSAINYPLEWVVFRITGYRPQADDGAVIVGEALLSDISCLVERLSAAAGIKAGELDGARFIDADALCTRWSVSRKTLDRYRRRGLIARRVIGEHGKPRLVFSLDAVQRFERAQQPRIEDARTFTRIGPELEARMIRRAAVYHRRFDCTLNQAAERLAEKYGRGHETIRQLLKRHDASTECPIFAETGPPTERERRLIERASFLAIEPSRLASRLKRPRASILRVINDQRAARLRSLLEAEAGGAPPLSPLEGLPKIGTQCLEHESVSTGLGAPGETDLLQLVQNARAMAAPTGPVERARATAYHFLLTRAVAAIGGLPRHGAKAGDVDTIETDLRWAARLKAELIRTQFPLVLRTIESTTGKPPEEMRTSALIHLLHDCIAALARAADDFHPHKGGRLAAPAGLALTRVITRFHRAQTSLPLRARATPRLSPGVTIPDWTRRVAPWQSVRGSIWLEPPPRVRSGLAGLGEPHRALLIHRYGWGERPKTIQEAAGVIGTTPIKAAQMERRGLREASQLALHHGHSKS
jgi:RNA polymerase primary sigma factor